MDKKPALSKTRYCLGLQCEKAMYFDGHSVAKDPSLKRDRNFETGRLVGVAARRCYPDGVTIDWSGAAEATARAMQSGARHLFEATFEHGGVTVRIDVLRRNDDDSWDIIEVKSSSNVREEHISDLAIQRHVAESAGLKVRKLWLKHLNPTCTFPNLGDNFESLFLDVDCTEAVAEVMTDIGSDVTRMLQILSAPEPPAIAIGPHCRNPYACDFKTRCWSHVPPYSVFELSAVHDGDKARLFHKGVTRIADIPDGHEIARLKVGQIVAARTGKPAIDWTAIGELLADTQYPAHFLDFETIAPPVPRFPGCHPRDEVPFQFSCHRIDGKGAAPTHLEYLHATGDDPRPALIPRLLAAAGKTGTIFAYFASFEQRAIALMAESFPEHREALLALNARFKDLYLVFRDHYFDREFRGSNSLKSVLPVVVPTMTYEGMTISEGVLAPIMFEKMTDPATPTDERARIAAALRAYCAQDTLALVEILRVLQR